LKSSGILADKKELSLSKDSKAPIMEHTEQRNEARYPLEAEALIHTRCGPAIPATATNISSAGMLLHIEQPANLTIDEQVTVDVKSIGYPDQPFSSWGMAKVAHMDDSYFGIQLLGGLFDSLPHNELTPR
jgi:hypothetical protein